MRIKLHVIKLFRSRFRCRFVQRMSVCVYDFFSCLFRSFGRVSKNIVAHYVSVYSVQCAQCAMNIS